MTDTAQGRMTFGFFLYSVLFVRQKNIKKKALVVHRSKRYVPRSDAYTRAMKKRVDERVSANAVTGLVVGSLVKTHRGPGHL